MPKDTGEFIISKSMNLRLPPIFGYTAFLFIPQQVRFSQSLSHMSSKKFVIERTRDLIYLKFVATDFSPKIISPSAGENSGDLA